MEKENGEGASDKPADSLLDAASLFGAYWGRDGGGGGGAAAAQAALFGFAGGRYPPPSTLGVAANQAASLGLHPANAAWWSMASHLAAQDYLARLQASGLGFPPGDPYSALSALGGHGKPAKGKPAKNERSGRNSSSSAGSASSVKDKSPATSSSSPHTSTNMRSSYGFPKISSPSTMQSSQSLSSLASLDSLVSHQHQHAPPKPPPSKHSRKSSKGSGVKERELALLRGDLMLAQAAAQGAYHAAVAAATKGGKNVSPLFNNPFGMGSDKDRHSGLDSIAGIPHTILSAALEGGDPASVLGGVRLPPDTEIIKYTSSMQGSKSGSGGTGRGRKKTISLDPPHVSVLPSTLDRGAPGKRQKMDNDYSLGGGARSSVEVIRLPSRPQPSALASPTPFNLSDYAGLSKELLQSIANQSGLSLAALERELASSTSTGLNLSAKSSNSSASAAGEAPLDLGVSSAAADDAPLNLSLKPSSCSSTQASDALSRLTSLSSSLNASATPTDRISRRKPGAKPRRVLPETETSQNAHHMADSPRPKSSGSEDSESVGWGSSREGRPRNLGRGVSKPKKNTVASLLAQSRALGLRPALAQQLLAESDIEKLRAALGEASTDSECPSDSCPSDSDASEAGGRAPREPQLRLPLAMGWTRMTVMKGLSRSGCIKGDVSYSPPEPHSAVQLKSMQELTQYLEQNPCAPLTRDNFTFSSRVVVGSYKQAGLDPEETVVRSEAEILKRLEEARTLAALSSGGRPTPPPPVDRRIELARQQQAARDARRDAGQRGRDQVQFARLARELERTEKAEIAKREKEARNQQMLEHIHKNRCQLSIQLLTQPKRKADDAWKTPDIVLGPASQMPKNRTIAPISLTLIPVSGPKDHAAPIKTINIDQSGWKEDIEEYNALDKMMDFAENASFDSPKRSHKYKFDLTIVKADDERRRESRRRAAGTSKKSLEEQKYDRLVEAYSRISEFINGCDWTKAALKSDIKTADPKEIEQRYLDAKNEFMSQYLELRPNVNIQKSVLKDIERVVEVIDLSEDEKEGEANVVSVKPERPRAEGALSISLRSPGQSKDNLPSAKRRKQEEVERQKLEEQLKRQQEREFKRQQAVLLKEQKYIAEVTKQRDLMYSVELERERRRQHTALVRQLDLRRRWEERERRKHQNLMDRLLAKEKKLQTRRKEMELLSELRRPQEDSTLSDQKQLPTLNRIPGLKLPGQAMADILQVLEFIHNFGQTLGFDMEALPTLNTLQMALLPDCCMDAEEDLMSVLTHLLVCSIEDPGIPHPGRHTTLLGQALRMGDITPANISEVLRIYLYANATGEVKALTGINQERERERRVADHHQSEAEMLSSQHNARNQLYYEHLHTNPTYRLSEALRDKPFLALNPTTKARILAFLCNELLQNKAVLRQIDASLDHLSRLRKERYLMDMKIRKVRVLQQRKARAEQAERQQALALERMQRLVEESAADAQRDASHDDDDPSKAPPATAEKDPKDSSKESSPCKDLETSEAESHPETEHSPPEKENSVEKESPKEGRKNSVSKEMLNNNKEVASPEVSKVDKDSVLGDGEVMSDVESEGTQPEEDEDKNLSSEELARKLEKLLRQSEQQLQQLTAGAHSLRATCYGQDRYWRRYWSLGKCGGVYVEGMESSQPELLGYQRRGEEAARRRGERRAEAEAGRRRRAKARRGQKENKKSSDRTAQDETKDSEGSDAASKTEDQIKSELELKNIKSELNLSDHTQIIKYEPNLKGHCKLEGSPIKMEEKYIQQKQNNELDMLDIEDSIPTAFLVQKPSLNKPMYASQLETLDKPQEVVKIENPAVKSENMDIKDSKLVQEDQKDPQLVNNLEELRKMAEAMSQMAQKDENSNVESEVKEEKPDVKQEHMDPELSHAYLYTKMLEGRWFSILRREHSLLTNSQESVSEKVHEANENGLSQNVPVFFDNHQTCSEIINCQGHRWDVSNNLHLLNDPSLFTLNSMVTSVQVSQNNVYADSSLTESGIDQSLLDDSAETKELDDLDPESETDQKEENDLEKELNADSIKADNAAAKRNSLGNPLGLLNFNALSTYVTCDSPPPIQMSADEYEQLEYCKVNGLPKKAEGNFVPRELRHGWWRITDPDMLKDLLQALHPRGVRERELHASFLQHLPTINNKLYIDKGDVHSTELSISHLDRVIAQNGGFPSPDTPSSYCVKSARRIDGAILEQVEQLEERVGAASLQVKGWRPSREAASSAEEPPGDIVERARSKLAALETNIERRYLKPPLGHSTGDATLSAVLQAEAQAPASDRSSDAASPHDTKESKGAPRGLATWRDAVARSQTSSQVAMALAALEGSIAWDKSIMKVSCQFCKSDGNDEELLLCDGCDKGYHTYCFKPKMEEIPDGDWYCWECVNKARGEKVCIVCGGGASGGGRGRLLPCALCARAYHQCCHYPPLNKSPRGKWYCVHCQSKAPPKKPRSSGKRKDPRREHGASLDAADQSMVPSPAPSHASTSTTADDCPPAALATPEKQPDEAKAEPEPDQENGLNHHPAPPEFQEPEDEGPPEKRRALQYVGGNGALELHREDSNSDERAEEPEPEPPREKECEKEKERRPGKKEKKGRHQKDLQMCKNLLEEMELHSDAWPFLLPVNMKQFPTYRKVIRSPMDLSTIKRKLHDGSYKSPEEFAADVRQMFTNCEVFNEDESPVGRAGHGMRRFFHERFQQLHPA